MTTNKPGMLHIANPAQLGQALGEVRQLLKIPRRELALRIAEGTHGQHTVDSVNTQLWSWDTGATVPSLPALPPLSAALAVDLALVFRDDA